MRDEEWGRGMGNGKWEIENWISIFFTLTFYKVEYIFSAAIINIYVLYFEMFCNVVDFALICVFFLFCSLRFSLCFTVNG